MAKKEQVKVDWNERVSQLNKQYNVGSCAEELFIPTGSILLDRDLGGGFATGRITELIAWEGSGKTTVCLHAVANAQKMGLKVAYIDAEHALDETYARAIGVDWDALRPTLFQPTNGDDAFGYAQELIKTGELGLVVFDSTSGMIPKSQLEAEAGASNIGKHARLFNTEVPKVSSLASKHGTACIFVSQFREKIGVMFGSNETTQAGHALKFFSSNRIELRKKLDKEGDDVVGIISNYKVIKCKTHAPYGTGSIKIVFGEGINLTEEIVELAIDYDIINKAGNTYSFKESKLAVGYDNLMEVIYDNPDLLEILRNEVINYSPNQKLVEDDISRIQSEVHTQE